MLVFRRVGRFDNKTDFLGSQSKSFKKEKICSITTENSNYPETSNINE